VGESDHIVADAAEKILADLADPQTVNSAKDDAWKAKLWAALEENGLTLPWVSEAHGGAGASLADGFEVLTAAGKFALTVPLAETMLAGWLLGQGDIASPAGAMSIAPVHPKDKITLNADGSLSGRARNVPFAREAQHFAMLVHSPSGIQIALVKASDVRRDEDVNLAGEPLDGLVIDKVMPAKLGKAATGVDQTALMLMGCVARSLQISGALQTMLTRTVTYANERTAFERKISKFQAVQHNLARLAGEVAAAAAAAGSAADTLSSAPAVGRRRHLPRSDRSKKSVAQKPPAPDPRSRTKCTARSALPRSTCCIASRCAHSAGATTSAMRVTGRSNSATGSGRAAPMICGRLSPPAEPYESNDVVSPHLRSDPSSRNVPDSAPRGARLPRRGDRQGHVSIQITQGAARKARMRRNSPSVSPPRAWIGMTWPKKYGGRERSFLERYVLTEEFRVANAPTRIYFTADRQSGPTIIRLRHREDQTGDPAAHRQRRDLVLHRHERTWLPAPTCSRPRPGRPRPMAAT